MDLACNVHSPRSKSLEWLLAVLSMARSGLIWFASAGPQKVAYGIRATSAQEQDEIAKRVGLFAWESQIDGCYNARTGLLAVCFDGGEPLSAATQADLAKKLG